MSQDDQITLYAGPNGVFFRKDSAGKMGAVIVSPALRKTLDKFHKDIAADLNCLKPVKVKTVKPTDSWDNCNYGYGGSYYFEHAKKRREAYYDSNPFIMDGPHRRREPAGPGGNPCHEIKMNGEPYEKCSLGRPFENQVTIE